MFWRSTYRASSDSSRFRRTGGNQTPNCFGEAVRWAMTHGLDPITVEVVRHKLEGIANEMQQTLLRSSFSPIVKEGLDASSSLFTIGGETLAQSTAVPIHLATLIPVVQKMLEVFPVAAMKPGDVYCLN